MSLAENLNYLVEDLSGEIPEIQPYIKIINHRAVIRVNWSGWFVSLIDIRLEWDEEIEDYQKVVWEHPYIDMQDFPPDHETITSEDYIYLGDLGHSTAKIYDDIKSILPAIKWIETNWRMDEDVEKLKALGFEYRNGNIWCLENSNITIDVYLPYQYQLSWDLSISERNSEREYSSHATLDALLNHLVE